MPLLNPPPNGPDFAHVIRTEEKGSDLLEPITIVRSRFDLCVGVLNPHPPRSTAWALMHAATFYRRIRQEALPGSQFPETMQDANATFHKPTVW